MDKNERAKRWSNGNGYNRYINEELNSFRKDAWKKQICSHFPEKQRLKILDVGTGPGFFSCILSEEGYDVTGIDNSDGMLKCARENAQALGVSPEFINMDVNELGFNDETFDVIVTRNVTWTLEYPEKVYSEFKRILKESGILLIYDANWHLHFFDEEKMKKVRKHELEHYEKYGVKEIVSGGDMEYFASAPLTNTIRPDWDEKVLKNLGFKVEIKENVGQFVYEQWEKDLYAESPLFEICASKKQENTSQSKMREYWQGRADSFGFTNDKQSLIDIGMRIGKYLPDRKLKVLDAGTGTGIIASSMALIGHEVTGIDLCSHMIEKASENSEKLGLEINFMCTSAGELPFADNTFDAIVSRNVIWALPEPEEVLKQWMRVLKPGGMLVYMDANHYLYHFDEQTRQDREKFRQINGSVHGGHEHDEKEDKNDYSLCDNTAYDLPMSKLNRPYEWDDIVLPKIGFDIVAEEINKPQNLLKYGIAKGYYNNFLIAAINGKNIR